MRKILAVLIFALCFSANATVGQSGQSGGRRTTEQEITESAPRLSTPQPEWGKPDLRTPSAVINRDGKLIIGLVINYDELDPYTKYSHLIITYVPIKIAGETLSP